MIISLLATSLLVTGFSYAAPVAVTNVSPSKPPSFGSHGQGTDVLMKFDNIDAGLAGIDDLETITSQGPYMNLNFQQIAATDIGKPTTGLQAFSAPNVMAFDAESALRGGASITAIFDDSVVSSFDLKSFYYGCNVFTEETLLSVPTNCVITITAIKDGEKIASQDLSYTVNDGDELLTITADMQKVELGKEFVGIDTVTFEIASGAVGDVLTVGFLDNMDFILYGFEGREVSMEEEDI